jgi:hypothetical protein
MQWRQAKVGLLGLLTGTAESFDDVGRIAEGTGVDAAITGAVALATEILNRAELPPGPHIWNARGEWRSLPENWRQSRDLLAELPAEFLTDKFELSACAAPARVLPLSAEWYASEVLVAAYWLASFRAAGNIDGSVEQAFKLGERASTMSTVVAGWPRAAEAGHKEFQDSRKPHPDAEANRVALLARDTELEAQGMTPGERRKTIASERGITAGGVKKALQRARNSTSTIEKSRRGHSTLSP